MWLTKAHESPLYMQLIFDKETNVFTFSSNITTTWVWPHLLVEGVGVIVYSGSQTLWDKQVLECRLFSLTRGVTEGGLMLPLWTTSYNMLQKQNSKM
jgi:hypothetical protein